ncbi:uncharacterized protein EAE98_001022 [Botrytis deweyae]|uniref:Uncharacterized protein n=1 Tax=Botrytis deweyae TaxID=2478750 RepID=A0ABQ7J1C3_9HELO|nr:uncharacterized protein EAE98_001022 [Botrytis deweyae]KAF7938684.1 hypothetical protein EAE98_001022 [Botrytis deweyae]
MMTGKRKATEIDDFQPLIKIDNDEHLPVVDLDCNQVRQEIQNFISSGEMNDKTSKEQPVSEVKLIKSMTPVLPSPPLLPHSVSSPSNSISSTLIAMCSRSAKNKRLSKPAGPYDVSGIELEEEDTESVLSRNRQNISRWQRSPYKNS